MGKKVFSFDDLTRLIDEDYSWRRKELKIVKDQIPNTNSPLQNATLRFAVPILYAHWEGFAKRSCELYLEFVSNKYLKHNELKPQFIALSMSKKLGNLEMKNIEEKTKTVEFLLNEIEKNSNIPTKNVIQTKSNLKFEVFEEIIFLLNLDSNKFRNYKNLINDVVDSRNNIAHGNYQKVPFADYENMHTDIQNLMELLKTELENSALNESYKYNIAIA
jgi:MAE_28990/MAE_18760-like HEPN